MRWEDGNVLILEPDDRVSHVIGSSKQKGNWKKFWLKHSGRKWPKECRILQCNEKAKVGAHVYVKGLPNQNFILPTCQGCNRDPEQEYGEGWVYANDEALVVRIEPHENTLREKSKISPLFQWFRNIGSRRDVNPV